MDTSLILPEVGFIDDFDRKCAFSTIFPITFYLFGHEYVARLKLQSINRLWSD